ncbi:integrase [Bifidobacterium parmae]|uniref:Integrase n=2 Tax=Bifidobacterium parmae TaxID=361854 RepID=A0A2N5J367_9BIFI|nr:site-specific tyrosine recombinase/integron integrase [Bifidobacterium parmae]PLS28629.1 integrase [Bifidobacterium parmae]
MAKYCDVVDSIDTYGCIEDLGTVVGGATPSKKRKEYFADSGISWITPKDLSNATNLFIGHGATDITDAGYQSCSTKLMPAGSVLFSSRAPVGYVAIAAKEVCTNQGFKSVVPFNNIGTSFVFCFLKDNAKEIEKAGSGTTFIEVSSRTMRHFVAPIPSVECAQSFSSYAEPLLNAIKNNENEIAALVQLRDALLPKLMSGEIDLSKVELPMPSARTAPTNGRLPVNNFLFCGLHYTYTGIHELSERLHMVESSTIESILQAMQSVLDARQLKQLKSVLSSQLAMEALPDDAGEAKELLDSFLAAKELEGCSERTLQYYESTLAYYISKTDMPLTKVDTEQLRSYLTNYQATHTVGKVTIDNIRRILATFFSWLEDEDYIVKSPARKIRRVKTPVRVKETISDEDMERLRDGCETLRDLAIIDLLSSTGMRVGELVKLNRENIDLGERECIVQGKGNKERKAYFDARTKLHLEEYLRTRIDDDSALFVGLSGKHQRITISTVESRLRSLGRKLRLPRIHPHKFRRTMATNAIDRGMPVEQVQKLLGHVKIDTTMQYAMVSQSNVKASHRRYLG